MGAPVYAPLSLLQPAPSQADAKPHSSGNKASSDSDGSHDMEAASGMVVVAADQAGRLSGLCLRCGRLLWVLHVQSSGGDASDSSSGSGGVDAAVPLRASVAGCGALPLASSAAGEPACAGRQRIAWTAGPGAAGVAEVPGSQCGCCSPSTAITSDAAAGDSCTVRAPEGSLPAAAAAMPAESFSTPIAFGSRVVFGCRNDYLYCVSIPSWGPSSFL